MSDTAFMRQDLPVGTVTFVFTDIEGSTRLLDELGVERYGELLSQHHRVCRVAWAEHGGVEVDTAGDAFFVAFPTASGALAAAGEAQEALRELGLRVRMGVHTGEVSVAETGYVGLEVHRAARIAAAAHGGQVVVSGATVAAAGSDGLVELGEHRFKDVDEPVAIFQLGEGSFPPLKTLSNTNLPRPASSFVGRERELSEVLSRFERGARLVTLTGPGGSGKTRLALEAAATLVPQFRAGAFWVGLAPLRDPALVTETIAQTLGAKDDLAEHIGERELLLLLDNLEQVIEAAPELSALLRACPNLRLLVTSRELLRVEGEVEYPVPPLHEPEAVALFCERAQTGPTEEVRELCARLDSLPLAVELAAARTRALSPAQILERLSQRLDLLKGGRDADPRQQTLRATIAWSYDLLSDDEQRLFRAMSVFAGGCTLAAAEEVCDADLDTLQSLVEKSLLRFTNERYWMLETIRAFAADALASAGERRAVDERHAHWFLELARQAEPRLTTSDQSRWFDRLTAELGNLRVALEFLDDVGRARLATALWRFWEPRNLLTEGRKWLSASPDLELVAGPSVAVRLHVAASRMAWKQRDTEDGMIRARTAYEVAARAADDALLALAGENLGVVVGFDDPARGRELLVECIDHARHAGDEVMLASVLNNLAYTCLELRDFERAAAAVDESIQLSRTTGNAHGLAYALHTKGFLALLEDRTETARAALEEALVAFQELGDLASTGDSVDGLAQCFAAEGDASTAATLWAAADGVRERAGFEMQPVEAELRAVAQSRVERRLGRAAFTSAWEHGLTLSLDAAVGYALGRAELPA